MQDHRPLAISERARFRLTLNNGRTTLESLRETRASIRTSVSWGYIAVSALPKSLDALKGRVLCWDATNLCTDRPSLESVPVAQTVRNIADIRAGCPLLFLNPCFWPNLGVSAC